MLRILVTFGIAIGSPAFGLSCKAPNFGLSFNRAAEAEEVYVLVYGQLRSDETIPDYVQGEPRSAKFTFVGKQIGQNGMSATQTFPVTVATDCAGSWCGPFPPVDTQMLAFFEQSDTELKLTSHACSRDFHIKPSLGQVSAIRSCMSALTCADAEIRAFDLN